MNQHGSRPANSTAGKKPVAVIAALIAVAALATAVLLLSGTKPAPGPTTAPVPAQPVQTNAQPVVASAAEAAPTSPFAPLLGRWLRPDGEYVIEIKSIEGNGEMRAGYFNPRPINVARAEAFQQDGKVKMYLELRDAGYPGSHYTLEYRKDTDQLMGVYFQAAVQESFEVLFVRMK